MTELEITQPEETPESADTAEAIEITETGEVQDAAEEQALQDAASDPGARVEETQTFEQAEAVESALSEAVETAEQTSGTPVPIPTPETGEEDVPESGPDPQDLPPGSGILEEPHQTVEMAEKLEDRGIVEQAEIPEGIEFELADGDDDGKDEATPINLPGPVAEEEDDDMQLISGPNRDDLPDGTGILEEPHQSVEMAEKLEDRGIVEQAEIPEGIEFELADGDDDGKDEATPINLPGPVAEEEGDDMQLISGPNRDDLPPGSGILEEPHQTMEMAEKPGDPGPASVAEVPEGMEFELAGDDDTVDRDDPGMMDPSELSESSGEDDGEGSKDATPINLPGPVPAQVASDPHDPPPPPDMSGQTGLSPDDVKVEVSGRGGADELGVNMEPIPSPEQGVAGSSESEELGTLPIPIPKPAQEEDMGASADEVGGVLPVPIPKPAWDEKFPSGNEAMEDDGIHENLQPAPDFADMDTSERSVVEIISKAIDDEEYRGTLLTDARSAVAGYAVAENDQSALGEMTQEAFDFFAAEVEKRFSEAKATVSEELLSDAHQQLMQKVVHAVWRDLNPGGLAYVLAYKIPQKHLS